jgi:IclR family transcriptional regulator, KDG regulon repressor
MDTTGTPGRPLRRALSVLQVLADAPTPLTLSELGKLIGSPKSTLHRIMRVLTDLGLATRMESRSYVLGDYFFQLAARRGQARVQSLSAQITPFLLELFQRTGKMVGVGMLSGTNVHHAGVLHDHHHSRLAAAWQHPVPAHCSAAGKLLMAETPRCEANLNAQVAYTPWTITRPERMRREFTQIRRLGLSYAKSEYIPGMVDVAAPVHLGNPRPVAAIAVAGAVNHTDLRSIGPLLLAVAGSIEENLAKAC